VPAVYDLFDPKRFAEKLTEVLGYHNFVLTQYLGAEPVEFQAVFDQAMADADEIRPMVTDVSADLRHQQGRRQLLFEGAPGTLLDIDHGTYPFVTSSNCVAGQAAAGSGVGPGRLHYVLGITKAYCTRVGGGPFPPSSISKRREHLAIRCPRWRGIWHRYWPQTPLWMAGSRCSEAFHHYQWCFRAVYYQA
jgi:adenylosuccinate synthase